jgi:hypothetical protein
LTNLASRFAPFTFLALIAACAASSSGGPTLPYATPAVDAGAPTVATPSEGDAAATALAEPDGSDGGVAATEADAGAVESTDESAKSAACPDGMLLVDGDYCTNLEMTCLRSTYAPQNKKTICWEFKEPTVCVGPKEHKRFCIDRYEYPNKKGTRPRVMIDFPQAQQLCADQGKRICTETEWTTACEGPSYKPYPYGYNRDPKICNGDQQYGFPDLKKAFSKDPKIYAPELARLYVGVPSGSQPQCVSDYGVYDMPGNADELASSETFDKRSEFDSVTTGGPWLEGVRNQCRPKIYTHNEGFAYYYLSFRCCAEPDGKPSDPRAPKQIKRKQAWRKVNVPPQISPPP